MKQFYILLTLMLFALSASPQKKAKKISVSKNASMQAFADSIDTLRCKYFSVDTIPAYMDSVASLAYDMRYYKLFMQPVLYESPIKQLMMSQWKQPDIAAETGNTNAKCLGNYLLQPRYEATDTLVNNLLLNLYLTNYHLNYVSERTIEHYEHFEATPVATPLKKNEVFSLFKPEYNVNSAVNDLDSEVSAEKPNFWSFTGNGSVQFSQNHISSNWYKGGESSTSILSYIMLNLNYNDKQRFEFDNRLEAKVGFIRTPSDSIREFNINSDLLRFTSKVGLRALGKWYYTFSAEFNTQFFRSYTINTQQRVSSFMAPANVIFNVGMDYKLNTNKVVLSTLISPLTYNFRYVGDPEVDETKFGLDEGDKMMHSFGSSFQLNMDWTIIPAIKWSTRFTYFTSYKKIETEWENTFNFILNRFLSAKLFVHARYFDMEADHKIQLNELLSFGLNYTW